MKISLISALTLTLGFLYGGLLWAYPNYVGFGYKSCLTCHYNPFGNGALNDYGRAVSAAVVADRLLFTDEVSDEQLSKASGFLFSRPKNEWFRPSFNYRGLYLINALGTDSEKSKYINMDAKFTSVFRLGPKNNRDKLLLVGSVAYTPKPLSGQLSDEPNYRSREHYMAYRLDESWGVYLGMMDKVFGIRVPEHTAFSRTITGLTMNDQSHGLIIHYKGSKVEGGAQYFLGNAFQDKELRQAGYSAKASFDITSKSRLGLSVLSSESEFLKKYMLAFHSKSSFGKGSSVMLEIGQVKKEIKASNTEATSMYSLLQNHIRLNRGLYWINNLEALIADTSRKNTLFRLGPALQYFPSQRVELRFDLYNTRNFGESTVSEDSWDFASQLHLWF